jgi:hypothetical protein
MRRIAPSHLRVKDRLCEVRGWTQEGRRYLCKRKAHYLVMDEYDEGEWYCVDHVEPFINRGEVFDVETGQRVWP